MTNAKASKVNKQFFSIEYFEAGKLKTLAQEEAKQWL